MKYLFSFALLALAVIGSAHAQRSSTPLNVWASAAAGGSENGVHGTLEGNIGVPPLRGVLTLQYTEGSEFLSEAPLKKHRMVNVLYGFMLNDGPLIARVSAGVGRIDGVEHVGWDRDKLIDGWFGRYGNFPEAAFAHVNVPVRVDALLKPFGVAGAGVFVQANLNQTRSFFSAGLQFALGDLR